MSELMNARNCNRDFRRRLLATVSAFALLATIYGPNEADATDQEADRPTVWIELGGQLEHIDGQGEPFAPAFLGANPNSVVFHPVTPLQAQIRRLLVSARKARFPFQPEGSDWIFSASLRYGRSSSSKSTDHQTYKVFWSRNTTAESPIPGEHPCKAQVRRYESISSGKRCSPRFFCGPGCRLGYVWERRVVHRKFRCTVCAVYIQDNGRYQSIADDLHFQSAPVPTSMSRFSVAIFSYLSCHRSGLA